MLDELVAVQEAIVAQLELPYRSDMATGNLGASAHRKFDLEASMPPRNSASASKCSVERRNDLTDVNQSASQSIHTTWIHPQCDGS